jgi:hypothetical protein
MPTRGLLPVSFAGLMPQFSIVFKAPTSPLTVRGLRPFAKRPAR